MTYNVLMGTLNPTHSLIVGCGLPQYCETMFEKFQIAL